MQFETVKSFLLCVLVGISLLLTFALWSYKPDIERFTEDVVEDSTDLGGTEETMDSLVAPASIIFSNGDNYFGFTDPNDRKSLYEDIQSWSLYDFRTTSSNGPPSETNQVEIVFPDSIPMALAGNLFKVNGDVNFPEWGFERIFITFNQDTNSMNMIFLSENGDQQATAVVNNSEKHERLWEYLTTYEGLSEFSRVETAGRTFYVPSNRVEVSTKSIAVQSINSRHMVDALFTNSDLVSRNRVSENEIYFTDSARGIMRVYPNRRTMEFQNPLETSYEQMDPVELLKQSSANINDHRGWTDDYHLMDLNINGSANTVSYQMYYEGYPIFGNNYSSIIEQQYRAEVLYQYNRPLFDLGNYLGEDDSSELMSGSEVIDHLENSSDYDMEKVYDIKVGYDLTYQSDADAITLDPSWFMDYNGSWQKIDFQDDSQQHREGT
ncbi:Two-component signal transduction system YycFG, regulatory protein YycH [Lentibacillus halodurans]|uniref:Two-component signal transduction system YycFG, regulatory protein YycH n=1 Tax=Lentibacillus halodurans TaxID=237679 RepID=A0A1I0ZX29_9BACI|nr:two-component system activity regulator YycH [Lentibacillus halodurans]SFB30151.1 Two-component signal transduction system YycFG, regulatory protein YycH [Lentibacillus halodurans]